MIRSGLRRAPNGGRWARGAGELRFSRESSSPMKEFWRGRLSAAECLWSRPRPREPTGAGLPDNCTWEALRDRRGRLWVSTAHGIGIWNGQTRRWENVASLREHAGRQIRQMQIARDGSIWALTITGAIVQIDPETYATTTIANFRGRNFVAIQAAPDGSIWATTRARLMRFVPRGPATMPVEVPLPAMDEAEIEYLTFSPKGVLWATGTGTLYRYDGENWRVLKVEDDLNGQTMTSLAAPNYDE